MVGTCVYDFLCNFIMPDVSGEERELVLLRYFDNTGEVDDIGLPIY